MYYEVYLCLVKSHVDKIYEDVEDVKKWTEFMIEERNYNKEDLKVEKDVVKRSDKVEQPSIYELQQYWLKECDDILADSNLGSKSKFYDFRDAYETYLFYGGRGYANEDIEMDALEKALSEGLSGE